MWICGFDECQAILFFMALHEKVAKPTAYCLHDLCQIRDIVIFGKMVKISQQINRKNEEYVIFLGLLNRQTSSKCLLCIAPQCVSVQVSAELQQEVLMSLIQTDPDIIDYLLRRKLR